MQYNTWIDKHKEHWLTAGKIREMNDGNTVELLIMDRNLCDSVTTANTTGKVYTADVFFRKNKHTFVKGPDPFSGSIIWEWGHVEEAFEFHIELIDDIWYPLRDGKINYDAFVREMGFDYLFNFGEGMTKDKIMEHIKNIGNTMDYNLRGIPDDAHIGWRGPAMLCSIWTGRPSAWTIGPNIHSGPISIPTIRFISRPTPLGCLGTSSTIHTRSRRWGSRPAVQRAIHSLNRSHLPTRPGR